MWHDNETDVDYLNFNVVAGACAKIIRDAKNRPISIGVSGGWGVGKSSLVRMISAQLTAVPAAAVLPATKYVVVTFNPWLYQGFDDARTALLQIVGDAVLRQAAGSVTLRDKAKSLINRINLLRLVQLGGEVAATVITGVPVGLFASAAGKLFGAVSSGSTDGAAESAKDLKTSAAGLLKDAEPLSLPNEIQAFRNSLEELLDELGITLVVFVDDLDRCLPKTTIATLEAIRLLLFLNRSAFVIAADNEFIRGAVKIHFEGTGLPTDVATSYFDKLIQVPLHVPRLGTNEAMGYIALLFLENAHAEGKLDDDRFTEAKRCVPERLRESWKGKTVDQSFLDSLVPQGDQKLLDLMTLAARLAPLLSRATAVNANPRLIKRFLNTVFMRRTLAEPQGIDLDVGALAKWHLLERCDDVLANALASRVSSNTDGRIAVLAEAEKLAPNAGQKLPLPFTDKEFDREWLQLPPMLGDTDLRGLLHLSRDTATREFGADELDSAGQLLREALATANRAGITLTEQIRAATPEQAVLAMARAWELRRSKRDWQSPSDVLMLVEVCKVHPDAVSKAESLLRTARIAQIAPALAPQLLEAAWAAPVIQEWLDSTELSASAKKAFAPTKNPKAGR